MMTRISVILIGISNKSEKKTFLKFVFLKFSITPAQCSLNIACAIVPQLKLRTIRGLASLPALHHISTSSSLSSHLLYIVVIRCFCFLFVEPYVPASCQDKPALANCALIVQYGYCRHNVYSSFCCRSCVLSGRLRLR